MKSRRYSPRVSRLFLLSGVNDSPVVTQVVIKIPATLRTALSATSSWRMDRGWYLCHSSRLTRSHSMGLTLWTLESADHTYDSSDFRPPRATCKLRCEIVTVMFVVVVLTLLMMFIPVVIQWYDSDKCSDDQYCPPHMVTVSHHSCCHWDGETLTADHSAPSPLRVSCYAHRPKTVTTSFQRGFPLRRWTESPHWSLPPPSCQSPHRCKSVQFSCGGCLS